MTLCINHERNTVKMLCLIISCSTFCQIDVLYQIGLLQQFDPRPHGFKHTQISDEQDFFLFFFFFYQDQDQHF